MNKRDAEQVWDYIITLQKQIDELTMKVCYHRFNENHICEKCGKIEV